MMNERIRELAEQAGFNFRVDCATDDEIVRIYKTADKVQKLAELIVKECNTVIADNSGYFISGGCKWQMTARINEHFGVE
jgi:hypothetical protein